MIMRFLIVMLTGALLIAAQIVINKCIMINYSEEVRLAFAIICSFVDLGIISINGDACLNSLQNGNSK